MPLYKFAEYLFPSQLGAYRDNFASAVRRTTRLPGMTGGFDPFGRSVAPREVGEVRQQFTLVATARSGANSMDAKREEVRKLVLVGTQPLYMRPTDYPTRPQRWCIAAVNDIQMPQQVDGNTDLWQPVTISFQVADPRWYSPPSYASGILVWDNGNWDTTNWAWNTPTTLSLGGTTDVVLTQGGIAETQPDIVLRTGTGETISNPIFQLWFGGLKIDELIWTGTIAQNSALWVNCRARSVQLNGVNVYSTLVWSSVDWMTMYPGSNTLRVIVPIGSAGTVEVGALDAWI